MPKGMSLEELQKPQTLELRIEPSPVAEKKSKPAIGG